MARGVLIACLGLDGACAGNSTDCAHAGRAVVCGVVRWCVVCFGMLCCGVVWCDVVRYDVMCCGRVWCDMVWYDMAMKYSDEVVIIGDDEN